MNSTFPALAFALHTVFYAYPALGDHRVPSVPSAGLLVNCVRCAAAVVVREADGEQWRSAH